MIAFIDDHREAHGVEPICKVLPIAPSTYYDHVARRRDPARLSARAKRDMALKVEVRRVFEENFRVYGVRKVWRQLQREGFYVARCTVERLMREMGLQGVIRGKPIRTTVSDKAAPCPLDKVNRQFHAPAPNRLWVSDFSKDIVEQVFDVQAETVDIAPRRSRQIGTSPRSFAFVGKPCGKPIGTAFYQMACAHILGTIRLWFVSILPQMLRVAQPQVSRKHMGLVVTARSIEQSAFCFPIEPAMIERPVGVTDEACFFRRAAFQQCIAHGVGVRLSETLHCGRIAPADLVMGYPADRGPNQILR